VRTFVDTNVLVYARDPSEGDKHLRARDWVAHLWTAGSARVSNQVLNEYYVTVTAKVPHRLSADEARADVRRLMEWGPLVVDGSTIERAWAIQDATAISYWDALIVASAAESGCERLLTEDLHHDQVMDGVRVVDPFVEEPS
jgi:predicted nucleic acid-binding protein